MDNVSLYNFVIKDYIVKSTFLLLMKLVLDFFFHPLSKKCAFQSIIIAINVPSLYWRCDAICEKVRVSY